MNRLQRAAVLTTLADKLRERGSWCGETHLQKAAYFLQELLNVPIEFEFILYKHGPFSFDLRDELAAICADGLLELKPHAPPYGPTIVTTADGKVIQERFPKTLTRHQMSIEFVAEKLGDKGVSALEGLATALYVAKEAGTNAPAAGRAKRLNALKPHIAADQARAFVEEVDRIAEEMPQV
ncbi:MAG: hypothetical protein AB1716_00450 [Planctomycetota bacterium]